MVQTSPVDKHPLDFWMVSQSCRKSWDFIKPQPSTGELTVGVLKPSTTNGVK